MAPRRRVLSALAAGASVAYAVCSGIGFAGFHARDSGSLIVSRVGVDYQQRQGPRDADVPYTSSAATGPGAEVVFKKRPFGILRYTPGAGGKGAMVQEVIGKSRYPGDPQGQGFSAGVKGGWVVKSINGQDVLNADFEAIMDMLDDEVADPRFSKSVALALEQKGRKAQPVDAPVTVTFATIPGYVYKGEVLGPDWEPAHR
eukprot:TRINITY_DN885_c0_g1_i1.p1 TRINITY_DN885_c0_g1~~TRINITY_DN885_c0_g1_i1.p1  ORF type:complete len:201 (-),score=48.60 TRINITY_DN885_c0_g1_i1:221-823(-)